MKYNLLIFLFIVLVQNSKAQLASKEFKSLDLRIERVMDSLKIPGIQVSITTGDSLVFMKGYGFSNVEEKIKVNPYQSRFQIGSITKVFTGICVQNAANNGFLDLEKDVDNYLDFKIDRPFGDKISLNNLLSHSSGIDEMWFNGGKEYMNEKSVERALAKIPVNQIRRAGETFSYSNLGINLAGHILDRETKKPTHQHYEEVIIKPLGLKNTGVSLTKDENRPTSYYLIDNQLLESPLIRSNLYTSGHIYSTAEDMSKFMMALLNRGILDSTLALKSDFLSQIGRKRFAYQEHDEYGYGLGIFITDTKKGKVFSHLGFVEGFASQMYLFENEKTGFFISANSQKGVQGLQEIFLHFLKEYLPQYQSNGISSSPVNVELKKFEGNYIPTRTSLRGIGRIQSLFTTRLSFKETEGGVPVLSLGEQRLEVIPTGPNSFVDTTKFVHKTISFNSGGERMIMNYSVDKGIYGIWPFMRLKWYEEQHLQYPFRILCALLFLFVPFYWSIRYLRNRSTSTISIKRMVLSLAMLSGVTGFMVFVLSSMNYERMQMMYMKTMPWQINAFALFNIVCLVFTIVAISMVFLNLRQKTNRLDLFVLALLVLVAVNNWIYNSFSMILY